MVPTQVLASPLSLLAIALPMGIGPSIQAFVLGRALHDACGYTMHSTAKGLLWIPVTPQLRATARPFIYGPFNAVGRAFAAILSLFLRQLEAEPQATLPASAYSLSNMLAALPIFMVAAVWLGVTWALRYAYVAEFYSRLRSCRSLDDSESDEQIGQALVDPMVLKGIEEMLRVGDSHQRLFVLNLLPARAVGLIEREVRIVFFSAAQSTAAALRKKVLTLALAARQPIIFSSEDLLLLFADQTASVDLLCLVALLMAQRGVMHPDAPAAASFQTALAERLDREACWQLRTAAAVAMLKLSRFTHTKAHLELQKVMMMRAHTGADMARGHTPPSAVEQAACIRLIAEHTPELISDGYLVYLLHTGDTPMVRAAIQACSARNAPMLVPSLVKHLANAAVHRPTRELLSKAGFSAAGVVGTIRAAPLLWRPPDDLPLLCTSTPRSAHNGARSAGRASEDSSNAQLGVVGYLLCLGELGTSAAAELLLEWMEHRARYLPPPLSATAVHG